MVLPIILFSAIIYETLGLVSYKLWNKLFKTEDYNIKEFRFRVSTFFSIFPFLFTIMGVMIEKFYGWLFKILG